MGPSAFTAEGVGSIPGPAGDVVKRDKKESARARTPLLSRQALRQGNVRTPHLAALPRDLWPLEL